MKVEATEPIQDNSATLTITLPDRDVLSRLPIMTGLYESKDKTANEVFDCLSKKYYSSGKTLGVCIKECSKELGIKRSLSVDERGIK